MKVALDPKQAKDWFGAAPPDLTVIARSRAGNGGSGADYLYTYLRTFYRDDTKATGWNNLAFPTSPCRTCCGSCRASARRVRRARRTRTTRRKTTHVFDGFEQITPGTMTPPSTTRRWPTWWPTCSGWPSRQQDQRVRLGVWVLLFLAVFTVIAWRLNAAYWKDVK